MKTPGLREEPGIGYWEWRRGSDGYLSDPSLKKLLGYIETDFPDDLSGWKNLLLAGDVKTVIKEFRGHVESAGKHPFACEVQFRHRNGHLLDIYFVGQTIGWDNGHPVHMIGSHTDISQVNRERRELLNTKELLNKTSQTARLGGWKLEMATGEISWTEETRNIFGVSHDFVPYKGSTSSFFKEGDDRQALLEAYKKAVEENIPYDLELRVITTSGKEIWTRTIGQPEFDNGKCIRLYGTFQDITERKNHEQQMQNQQAQLNSFILHAPAAIAILDNQMNYVAVSLAYRKTYGLETADLIGKNHYDLFPGLPERWKEFNRRCLAGEVISCDEDSFRRLDGHIDWLQWEMRPWYEINGDIGGIIVFTEIITEKKKAKELLIAAKEEAEEATKAKSQFLSVMSHEIRTPMNAVIGFTNLLLQDPRSDQLEYLNILKFSAENLMVLINDILDLNKIEAGKMGVEAVSFQLANLLENLHYTFRQQAENKGLNYQIDLDPAIPDTLLGDPVRLGQVINNLLNNAIKFTSQGSVLLQAKLREKKTKSIVIHIEIADTGIGIPNEKQADVFETFTQASTETTRKYGGTGLGLAITKKLLELMGTHIKLVTGEGMGSSFSFDIELELAGEDSHPVNGTAAPAPDPYTRHREAKILIVDDNKMNVLLVKRLLKQWNFKYDSAENGRIAVELIRSGEYDLVLMDIQMPEMDGYQATKEIRALNNDRFKDIPIIALTASTVGNLKGRIRLAGMDDFISKPFDPDQLYKKILYHLNKENVKLES